MGWIEAESQDGLRDEAGSSLRRKMIFAHSRWRTLGEPLRGWSCPGHLLRSTTRYPPHVQVVVDQVEIDPHGRAMISAGLDFDEKGKSSTMTKSLMTTWTQTRERPNPITVLLVY